MEYDGIRRAKNDFFPNIIARLCITANLILKFIVYKYSYARITRKAYQQYRLFLTFILKMRFEFYSKPKTTSITRCIKLII